MNNQQNQSLLRRIARHSTLLGCGVVFTSAAIAIPTDAFLRGGLVFNEILIDPNSSSGLNFDTDGNGSAATTDEFVELFNSSSSPISLASLQLWDDGFANNSRGAWYEFGNFTLDAGGFATVLGGVQAGGSLPANTSTAAFFDAGQSGGVINNGGDNVVLYDSVADSYIQFTYNGDTALTPEAPSSGYEGFSATATRIGSLENWGSDVDGASLARSPNGDTNIVRHSDIGGGSVNASPSASNEETAQPPVMATAREIYDIQGAGHQSPFTGDRVATGGVVTALASNGFYLQNAAGDNDDATSDAIFVFTGATPTVAVQDAVTLEGTVAEFQPGGASTDNLTSTQLTNPDNIVVNSSNNPLPQTVLGVDRIVPTEVIEDDAFASFDVNTDGIDFYESLEGMRVTLPNAQAVSTSERFGEIYAIANSGAGATGVNANGGITVSEGDLNPERLHIDDTLFAGSNPDTNVGDQLGDVTGVIGYSFGNYELLPPEAPTVTAGAAAAEVTTVVKAGNEITVASYNVLNLDPGDGAQRFTDIALQIVNNLQAPDIIALQEVQDNNGPTNDGTVSASVTLQMLVDALNAEVGAGTYAFIDNSFIGDGTNGGQPGGNIRVAYLYDTTRVTASNIRPATDATAQQNDPNSPFFGSRLPLAADFEFNGETLTLVNNHFSSKGGSSPLYGGIQPFINGSADERTDQAQEINDFVDALLAANPNGNVVVLGDLNEFYFDDIIDAILADAVLTNLWDSLSVAERYSFIFEGNSQALDHILITDPLLGALVGFDVVHGNAGFTDAVSDHDPLVASFRLGATAIPLPGSLALLMAAGLLLGWRRRAG